MPPGCPWAPALASRALRVEGGSRALWLLSRALPSGRGQIGLRLSGRSHRRAVAHPHGIQSAAAPQMYRSVGLRPLALEHRNDKCDPCATTLAGKDKPRRAPCAQKLPEEYRPRGTLLRSRRSIGRGRRQHQSPQHNCLPLGARRARPQERVRRQRLDWRGRPLDALLDSFGRRPPQAPQPLRQH